MKRLTSEHPAVKAVTDAVQRLERAEAENASAEVERFRGLVVEMARFQTRVIQDEDSQQRTLMDRIRNLL